MIRRKNRQALQQDLYVLSAEVSALAADPPDDPSLALNELRQRVSRLRADFEKVASGIGSGKPATVIAMADNIVDPVEDALSERPFATIALGLGLGFVLGMVWGRTLAFPVSGTKQRGETRGKHKKGPPISGRTSDVT